jgi:hypothetical protein
MKLPSWVFILVKKFLHFSRIPNGIFTKSLFLYSFGTEKDSVDRTTDLPVPMERHGHGWMDGWMDELIN